MLDQATEERIRVRYAETDQMGHAYYANYFAWFEQARGAWCRDRGFTYLSLEDRGLRLPVVEAHARYRGEVKYDDLIIVRVTLKQIKRAAMHFVYEIENTSTGLVTTEGYTWHVFMGSERKAISVPEDVRALLLRDPHDFQRL